MPQNSAFCSLSSPKGGVYTRYFDEILPQVSVL